MRVDFSKGKVLVVGDLMLDRYFFGSVGRISPEAPVPVVKVTKTLDTLGGAGNVANNCAHLGAPVCLVGPLGSDESGAMVKKQCSRNRIEIVPVPANGPTITKTRIIGERQQIVRVDLEKEAGPDDRVLALAQKIVAKKIVGAAAVVISDYGKGFCSPLLCSFVIGLALRKNIPVIVDPKGRQWEKYRGANVVTPNVKELADIAGTPVDNSDDDIVVAARNVRKRYRLQSLLVTRSERGMTLVDKKAAEHFPTEAQEVFDVSGAGDTVVATLAACLASGRPLREAVAMANKAAGIVVGKIGTAPVELAELRAALDKSSNPKLLDPAALVRRCALARQQGKKIVFTNGCFDILHRGHVHLLGEAKKTGDLLVVALNSDRSARTLRRGAAPINGEADRAHLVAAIDAVDCITLFNETTPLQLIKKIRPDAIVKGGNYRSSQVVGREYAGKTVIVPHLAGYSTKDIARKICGKP
jgi:D-beta-D-heptose 7-phosphate kinase / D-beta-D-heptose 1-phosphate adenosyltransferase